jgi:Fe-S oxidoreductase
MRREEKDHPRPLLSKEGRKREVLDETVSLAIKESLEHCLACKGCKADCPVSVDIATYKAEFMAHYYAHQRLPLKAQVIGLIPRWTEFASRISGFINFFTQTLGLREIVKKMGGIAPQRQIPCLAKQNFRDWFAQRPVFNAGKPPVILWADTFNNYFHPQVAIAAVKVLEAVGYQVRIPTVHLCCGRPLYDSGQLDLAKQLLQEILQQLRAEILAGVPIVGLEPSCLSVFRDELLNFFPQDELANKLSQQTFLFSEFLVNVTDFKVINLSRKAIVQGHCHHKALWGMMDEVTLLERLGLEVTLPEAGCCGMAGAFGFDKQNYVMSVQLAELALLPAIRSASEDTLIIADGFSCREQIAQTTGRQVLHPAEVVALAVEQS